MGASIYIAFEKKVTGADALPVVDGKMFAKNMKKLAETATTLGIMTLDSFVAVNQEELADLIGENAVAEAGIVVPKEQWFDASDGLTTVNTLITDVRKNKARFDKPDLLLKDLVAMQKNLAFAESKKIGFRLVWDI